MMRFLLFLLLNFFVIVANAQTVKVAAASDLQFALGEIAARYERESGEKVVLSFGASGNFARQIPQGAPFDLFLSADEEYIFRLADRACCATRASSTPSGASHCWYHAARR
jgi:molybdate transport system substrate-binding protein